ncbi:MAG: DUF364 domain-containing protein [Spirochaetales bacterium]|nr:DUF364 domain-containing protein [Spirochaetales bacterium]
MNIVTAVQEAALGLGRELRVARTAVGGIYVAVQLEDGSSGVGFRFPGGEGCHRGMGPDPEGWAPGPADPWAGKDVRELIPLLGGEDLVQSALALATINAMCTGGSGLAAAPLPGDVLEHVELREGDRVCMVGCFLPVVARLEERRIEVVSVDQRPRPGALPAEDVESVLPKSQVALVTATSLVNATLDHLLELASGCRSVALLGPSTPMLPGAFASTPVRLLSGIRISDPARVLEIVADGGGFRDYRPHVVKINLAS